MRQRIGRERLRRQLQHASTVTHWAPVTGPGITPTSRLSGDNSCRPLNQAHPLRKPTLPNPVPNTPAHLLIAGVISVSATPMRDM